LVQHLVIAKLTSPVVVCLLKSKIVLKWLHLCAAKHLVLLLQWLLQ
jgi:hypothetical protein